MLAYTETTEYITVTVQPFFIEDRSDILRGQFFFVYYVSITNEGTEEVRLRRRHWHIRDSAAEDYDVEGEGVVGQQPVIQPGESHMYNSFCVLKSFEGSMEGTYQMERKDGSTFEAVIPRFHLRARAN